VFDGPGLASARPAGECPESPFPVSADAVHMAYALPKRAARDSGEPSLPEDSPLPTLSVYASGHRSAAISRSLYFWILPDAVMG
jgi:hypothetical protein